MKYVKVRIVIGSSDSLFDIYYNSIDSNKRALIYSTGLPATGLTNEELSDIYGVLVSVPDDATSIVLSSEPNAFCSENGNVNNDSYTIPIGCYTYTITSDDSISEYSYIDCECNEILTIIDGTYGQVEHTFCAMYGTVNAGDLEVTLVQGCEVVSIELCYDENEPGLACDCGPAPTPTPTPTAQPCDDCVAHDVTIGSQIWTGCNLDVTTYRNGDTIPQVTDPNAWSMLSTGAWCYYENNSANGTTYGKLYNIYAILDPRGIAPVGYHVPNNDEWTTLTATLGGGTWIDTWGDGSSYYQLGIGESLKEANGCHWFMDLSTPTNSSGFTALPAGVASTAGYFIGLQSQTIFASTTLTNITPGSEQIWGHSLSTLNGGIDKNWVSPNQGISVRLIKD